MYQVTGWILADGPAAEQAPSVDQSYETMPTPEQIRNGVKQGMCEGFYAMISSIHVRINNGPEQVIATR